MSLVIAGAKGGTTLWIFLICFRTYYEECAESPPSHPHSLPMHPHLDFVALLHLLHAPTSTLVLLLYPISTTSTLVLLLYLISPIFIIYFPPTS
jgi:hypothetical protein